MSRFGLEIRQGMVFALLALVPLVMVFDLAGAWAVIAILAVTTGLLLRAWLSLSALLRREQIRRIEAEARLRAFTRALETMQLGVTISDPQGRIVYTNPADAAMHGYEPFELLRKNVRTFAPVAKWSSLTNEQLKAMHSWTRETVNVHKNGTLFRVRLLSDVVLSEKGEPLAVVTICERLEEKERATTTTEVSPALKTLKVAA